MLGAPEELLALFSAAAVEGEGGLGGWGWGSGSVPFWAARAPFPFLSFRVVRVQGFFGN